MNAMRVVFFGAPEYALPTLRALIASAETDVVAVVTQPDRPTGRSGRAVATPVRQLADAAGIEVLTPEKIRRETTERIAALSPDVGVLAASGHILPQHLLDAIPHGVLNIHASLLPRHRGASPVAAAILAGDEESGASIMLVVRELDAGPVLGDVRTPIAPLDTTATLTERIAGQGAELLMDLLPRWVAGELAAAPQDASLASEAPRLLKQAGALRWTLPATELWRRVRAFDPWPQASTTYQGSRLTVHEAWPVDLATEAAAGTVLAGDGQPLTPLLPGRASAVVVVCGTGGLALLRIQRAGRRALAIEQYVNGDRDLIGSRLGDDGEASDDS